MTAGPIRVLHVDDSPSFCTLVGFWLAEQPDLEPAGVVHDFDQALEQVAAVRPDVVLLDTVGTGELPVSVAAVRAATPGVRVIVYSGFAAEAVVDPEGGRWDGYVHKGADERALVTAIRRVRTRG